MLNHIKRLNLWRWLVAGCSLLAFVIPVLAQTSTVVKVSPAQTSVAVGETVSVLINIENVTDLYSIELAISFDNALLEVIDANTAVPGVQITPGDFFIPDFPGGNAVVDNSIEYAGTKIVPSLPVTGNGTLIRIDFRAKAEGEAHITLDSILLTNPIAGGINNTRQGGNILIGNNAPNPTATPIPAETLVPAATLAPTPSPAPPVAPTARPVSNETWDCTNIQGYHSVRRGESLYAIARAYQVQPHAITACNRLLNPRRIHASNRLAIPNTPWMAPPGPTAQRQFGASTRAATCRLTHQVRTHETLTFIAGQYSVSVWGLAQTNHVANPNVIYAGQTLCIP